MSNSDLTNEVSKCFTPIADRSAKLLILGSLPGKVSLQEQRYYAQPRNSFWPIMMQICNISKDLSIKQRYEKLISNYIAVWDVCAEATRPGSLDSRIVSSSIITNDFNQFFQKHKYIKRICFNGKKAAEVYVRYVVPSLDAEYLEIPTITLPSTSPANAATTFEEKLRIWHNALSETLEHLR